ncbi:MAG: alpha/beta fold hydrolase [Thermomicrobiales bacterium]
MNQRTTSEWGSLPIEWGSVRSGEFDLAVGLLGSGPALVLLHGIGSRGVSWIPVAAELAAEFRLVILDLRGHGASSKPERGYLISDYARDLDAVLNELGLERPLIIGHSLGGMTALEWAIGHPHRAAALVIEDSPMNRGGEGVGELFDGWIALSQMSVEDATAYYMENTPGGSREEAERRAVSITTVAPGVYTDMRAYMVAQNGAIVIPSYSGITSPTLLVYGDLGTGGMVPGVLAEMFERTISGAEAVQIPNGTHGLHRDTKAEFLEIVLPFLRAHSVSASRLV